MLSVTSYKYYVWTINMVHISKYDAIEHFFFWIYGCNENPEGIFLSAWVE